jgi:hypothetical protein
VIHLGNPGLELAMVVEESGLVMALASVLVSVLASVLVQALAMELEVANLCNMHFLPIALPQNRTNVLLLGNVVRHSQIQWRR